MPFITRQAAAVAAVIALSAAPTLASSPRSSTGAVKAKTALTAKIAEETPLLRLKYTLNHGVSKGLAANAVASDGRVGRQSYPGRLRAAAGQAWVGARRRHSKTRR